VKTPGEAVAELSRRVERSWARVVGGEGGGRAAGAAAALSWVREAPHVVLWGDMDADGLEILSGRRAAGLHVRSLFMDVESYDRWERSGVDHDHHGAPIGRASRVRSRASRRASASSTSGSAPGSGSASAASSRSGTRSTRRSRSCVR
jgi:hypothetical protein